MKIKIKLSEINPFVRYVHCFQPNSTFSKQDRCAYDARCFLVLHGGMDMIVPQETYRVTENQLILLPAGVTYRFAQILPETEVLGINFDYTQQSADKATPIVPSPPDHFLTAEQTEQLEFLDFVEFNTILFVRRATHLIGLLEEIEEQYLSSRVLSEMETSARMKLLLSHIATTHKAGEVSSQTVEQIISYIHLHYNRSLSNQEIGQALNFHPNYLNRIMQKSTGHTLRGYLNHYRLTRAMHLLQTTSLSVGEIAEKTGFGDPQQFSKIFRRFTGHTPSEYRKIY